MCHTGRYLAIGINLDGAKEVLGMWVSENEGAKFWLQVVTELKNSGVQDIFIASVDGLKGFPEATLRRSIPPPWYNFVSFTWYATF